MSDQECDVAIAGGGIARLPAGLLSARAGRKTRVLTGAALGGHLLSVERIDAFPGFPDGLPGYDLCPMVEEQATAAGAECSAAEAGRTPPPHGRWGGATGAGGGGG